MVSGKDKLLIDASGIFEKVHKSFLGVPLVSENCEDQAFSYGALRDILRLCHLLGTQCVVLGIGKESYRLSSKDEIARFIGLWHKLGMPYVSQPDKRIIDICFQMSSVLSAVVTNRLELLQLCDYLPVVVLTKGSGDFECFASTDVKDKIGVKASEIPTLMDLTNRARGTGLTKRQAVRLVEKFGKLEGILRSLDHIGSSLIRGKIEANLDSFEASYLQMRLSRDQKPPSSHWPLGSWSLDTPESSEILASLGFHSLIRLTNPPIEAHSRKKRLSGTATRYQAVTDAAGLGELESLILHSGLCTIDTETDSKDPRQATLLGVSLSFKKGEAFYVPTTGYDLKDIEPNEVIEFLKRVAGGLVQFVGHNIKYDILVLRRQHINIHSVVFDTLLAAFDCFGDLPHFNLKYLAKRLLGENIRSYKEIVGSDGSFVDLPFAEVVGYSCSHADMTMRLYEMLRGELSQREMESQYETETLPLMRRLADLEYLGISVDLAGLTRTRQQLADEALRIRRALEDEMGTCADLDSQSGLDRFLRGTLKLGHLIGSRKITLALCEEIAIAAPLVRTLLEYKRLRGRVKAAEAVISSSRHGKVWPLFNQIRTVYGQISSMKPNLFNDDSYCHVRDSLDPSVKGFFRDRNRSLNILLDLSQDSNLRNDLIAGEIGSTSNAHLTPGFDYGEFLLLAVTGESDHKLCRHFSLDSQSVSIVKHELESRYTALFGWLDEFQRIIASKGFAVLNGKRKYFDGLRSSNIEKRKKALRLAVRWAVQY